MTKLISFLLKAVIFESLLLSIARVIFYYLFKDFNSNYATKELINAFILGARLDLQLVLIIFLPILIFIPKLSAKLILYIMCFPYIN